MLRDGNTALPCCVAYCIDHQTRQWADIGQGDIDFLVERLNEVFAGERVEYDGQEEIDGETRLYFFTNTPARIVPVMLLKLREIPWCSGSRVIMQSDRLGAWVTHPV
jgi:hypothetical protein